MQKVISSILLSHTSKDEASITNVQSMVFSSATLLIFSTQTMSYYVPWDPFSRLVDSRTNFFGSTGTLTLGQNFFQKRNQYQIRPIVFSKTYVPHYFPNIVNNSLQNISTRIFRTSFEWWLVMEDKDKRPIKLVSGVAIGSTGCYPS